MDVIRVEDMPKVGAGGRGQELKRHRTSLSWDRSVGIMMNQLKYIPICRSIQNEILITLKFWICYQMGYRDFAHSN